MRRAALSLALLCSSAMAQERFVVSETLDEPRQVRPQPLEAGSFVVTPKVEPEAATPPVSVGQIHEVLVGVLSLPEISGAPPVREFIVFTPPPSSGLRSCGACDWMKRWTGTAINGAIVTYQPGGNGPWPEVRLADVPNDPLTGKPLVWHAALSRQQLEQYLAQYPAPAGALPLGTIKGKTQVDQLLKGLNAVGPGEVTVAWKIAKKPLLGNDSASLNVPTSGTATYRWSPDQMELEFKPPLMLVANSWLKVGQQVQGGTVTRDRVTLDLPGVIDLSKRLVE